MKEGSVIPLSTHYQHKDERILYVVVFSCVILLFAVLFYFDNFRYHYIHYYHNF